MGLIVFVFFFLVVLAILAINLVYKKAPYAKDLFMIAGTIVITTLLFLLLILALYFNFSSVIVILSKIFIVGMVFVSFFTLQFTVKMPYFERKKNIPFTVFNSILHLGIAVLAVLFIRGFFWNALSGFKFNSEMIAGIPVADIFLMTILLAMPFFAMLISIYKIFKEKSGIYRQQMIIYFAALFFSAILWGFVYYLSTIFSWAIAITPLGYLLLVFFTSSGFSTSMVYDRKQIAFALLRFLIFILIFAAITGFWASLVLTSIRSFYIQIVLLMIGAAVFFVIRNFVSQKFKWLLGDTSEYAKVIEEKLQHIDYTEGREKVMENFSNILLEHLHTSSLSILIAGENEILEPVYSTLNVTSTFNTNKPVFEFLLNENIQVIMRSQVLTNPDFADVRSDLIGFMNSTYAEILICVREGQKLIGVISVSAKKRKEAYTSYDFDVLKNLYSYFFLVVYYLRNIAKQDIVLILDREIEMSDQIIGSIQKNIDIVEKKSIEVDSVAFSAHQLGGDFTDFIRLSENRYLFLIGDVSGKGLSASMSMVILKSVIHTYLSETPDFKELVVKINSFIKDNLPKGTFLAGLFGIIDFKESTIYYLNCGIPLMSMYIDSYKNVIEIQGEGRVLGFVKNIRPFLKVRKITMNRNDIIVFVTDGLLDSKNLKGDKFGNDRVSRLIAANKTKSASEISNAIYKTFLDYIAHEIEDDITIMTFKHI
ncbi:PP2C family protein-serine/threonine phosphatase [Treponema putidum]|uniref:PP2C family protein-serine/threonine phosphatase n=1 Tax=Treponema putidum TaxID=221027 RepID=UPI0004F6A0C3|nr:SpoIIE family protein phosphatase [Treponema putidum]AIN93148.1 siderophore-interacting protein [Treponema putidum]TWI78632.1 stage II sporulation protein E [Treponema putidum]UTY31885.1 siderophore-interacting protein [Treponema putidum]